MTNDELSSMKPLWRYECQNCGNGCLVHWEEGRPNTCSCGRPEWKLLKSQRSYSADEEDVYWKHPLGEV